LRLQCKRKRPEDPMSGCRPRPAGDGLDIEALELYDPRRALAPEAANQMTPPARSRRVAVKGVSKSNLPVLDRAARSRYSLAAATGSEGG